MRLWQCFPRPPASRRRVGGSGTSRRKTTCRRLSLGEFRCGGSSNSRLRLRGADRPIATARVRVVNPACSGGFGRQTVPGAAGCGTAMPSPILVTRLLGWSPVCRSPTGALRHPVLSAPPSAIDWCAAPEDNWGRAVEIPILDKGWKLTFAVLANSFTAGF